MPSNQQILATEVARAVVAELAPEELGDFGETAEEYWRSPRRVRGLYGSDDAIIGFGGIELAIIAPAALYIAMEVARFILDSVKGGLGELVSEYFKELLPRKPRAANHGSAGTSTTVQLTAEQLAQAHTAGLRAARELGLSKTKSELIVSAVVMHVARIAAGEGTTPQP